MGCRDIDYDDVCANNCKSMGASIAKENTRVNCHNSSKMACAIGHDECYLCLKHEAAQQQRDKNQSHFCAQSPKTNQILRIACNVFLCSLSTNVYHSQVLEIIATSRSNSICTNDAYHPKSVMDTAKFASFDILLISRSFIVLI